MKTRPIKKLVQIALQWPDKVPETFVLPSAQARLVANLIRELAQKPDAAPEEDNLSWRTAAKKEMQHGDGAAYLRGLRLRESLSQAALAKELGVPQSHISEMEHGKRSIGKAMARRLAAILHAPDYRLFL